LLSARADIGNRGRGCNPQLPSPPRECYRGATMQLDLTNTSLILAAALAVVVAMLVMDRRKPPPGEVRLFPVIPVMMVAALVVILMLAHLVSLFTGHPFQGRNGF
jgi:hypothetical protein